MIFNQAVEGRKVRQFSLSPLFVEGFRGKQPPWGPLGFFTYARTYSRVKPDGTSEEFWETCQRVVEGCFNIQKIHCYQMGLPWNEQKAQKSAQDMFQRMFEFKFTPPGRGLAVMGTDVVYQRGSASLQNCAFVSSEKITEDFAEPFCFLMDMSMVGVGVGGDTRGAGKIKLSLPKTTSEPFIVQDTREGWVDLVRTVLNSFIGKNPYPLTIDYSLLRGRGVPLKTFGGTASGPKPLYDLVVNLTNLLLPKTATASFTATAAEDWATIGLSQSTFQGTDAPYRITSSQIVDIFNFIGKAVVAGGIRRCLPKGTLVHTSGGLLAIEKVTPGMQVMTAKGYSTVTDWVSQGEQPLTAITTQMGVFECTDKHKIAVISDISGGYLWKMAKELELGDRMVFVDQAIEGKPQDLPPFQYVAPKGSTTCKDITIPRLTPEVAWFFGLFHGDGCVQFTNKGNKGLISIAVNGEHQHILERVKAAYGLFGVKYGVIPPNDQDNSYKVNVSSKQLALYLSKFKVSKTSIQVPDFVLTGTPEIRAAYVAGLSDADGCFRGRPMIVVSSVYPDYMEQVQAVLASLGIPTRLSLHKDHSRVQNGWQPIYYLTLVGDKAIRKFKNVIVPFMSKFEDNRKTSRSQNDYGFPSAMAVQGGITGYGQDGKQLWASSARQLTVAKLEEITGKETHLVPVEVLCVEQDVRIAETYDISVEAGEFVAQGGYLVHNTAEIMFGEADDAEFMTLKQDIAALNDRRWASNNSILGKIGMDYSRVADSIAVNGEPGIIWLDSIRKYSRMGDAPDNKDWRVMGANPCSEQGLEDHELCNLVECYPAHHDSYEDFKRTLKMAYLYAKTVTLIPTHNQRANAVMMRNRRIGASMSGIVQAVQKFGRRQFLNWCDDGYKYVQTLDRAYSDWLGIPLSIKTTTVKPSGTVSLLCGATPGIHFPHSEYYIRHIRVSNQSPLCEVARLAGYEVFPDQYADETSVVAFPVKEAHFIKGKSEVSLWEQFVLVADMQAHWSDNMVSATITFNKEEIKDIKSCLEAFETRLKGVSMLPLLEEDHGYFAPPYQTITKEQYEGMISRITAMEFTGNVHDRDDAFCDGDKCVLPTKAH